MTPQAFIEKWQQSELKERSASQSHFNDLCTLLGEQNPTDSDSKGEWFCFEKGAKKTGAGDGWADVWKRGHFGWEYKGPLIGHYFRNLYTIIKIVDRSSVENKRDYTNIIRAQLSSSELVLLFYNCISPWGRKFKPLVERYALLKTLPEDALADERDRSLYEPSAFGDKESNAA